MLNKKLQKEVFSLCLLTCSFLFCNAQWNPQPNWKDSYEANGLCWCNSTFDHNLASKTIAINGTAYSVVDICDELEQHPLFRNEQNNDPVYNDIQCGNGPVNDAPDEAGCPGRVDMGSAGCDIIGPGFDMSWLSTRTRFGGGQNQATITGELKKWHKVTLSFEGPNTSEAANPNPFTDYRLLVTFTNGGTSYTVPGYYAADGDAAETSATAGNKWLVHFAPDKIGVWTYTASFRQGTDVAIDTGVNAGTSAGFFDGETGNFSIAATDKTGRDHRGKGRLSYVGEHYLQYGETGEYFVKMGADAPENTLAYEDFDDVPNRGNRRKNWTPHAGDYLAADASNYTWKSGKGTELLGAIKYLSDKGMNVFSFLTLSLHGDDENVFPYLLKVATSTYNGYNDATQWNDGVHHDRFDVSRLEQWEKVFEYADKKGMYMHFKTMETENDNIMDGNGFGRERKIYYRELIARFGHHLALNWNLSEEITLSASVIDQTADFIKSIDPYNHIVVFHTYPGEQNRYDNHYGSNSSVDGASIQTGDINNSNNNRNDLLDQINNSANAGKKWVVGYDEPGTANIGIDNDPNARKDVRHKVVWNTLMAGSAGAEFYYGYQTNCTDLTCQDHRSRDEKYTDANYALNFFHTYLPFHEMSEIDNITGDTDDYVFGKAGEIYAVYLPNGGSSSINLPAGDWQVEWYNPRNGQMQSGTTQITNQISAPDGNDWTALITNCNGFEEANGLVTIEAESLNLGGTDWEVKTTASGYTGSGYIEWTGANYFAAPGNGLIETSVTINTPGIYKVKWHNRVGFGVNSTEHNDTWLRFPDADDFFGQKGASIIYPYGSGQTPNPNGAGADGWFKVFLSGSLEWVWNSSTSDNDGHDIFVKFDNPGTYTLQLSGRSQYHQIDRITLFLPSASDPFNLGNPQTVCNGSCTVGASCNDNDSCTTNDVFTINCNCVGTFQDADNDSVCDTNDLCPGFDDTLIGTSCDDGNDCTVNDVYTSGCECRGNPPTTESTIILAPIQDAYLQGTTLFNTNVLRVENGNRVSYMMFDLSNINGTITSVDLEFTVDTDGGDGDINVELGDNNNWTETNLSTANKPNTNGLLGQFVGTYAVQTTYSTSLSNINTGGLLTLIITHLNGNDVSFKSKENGGASPRLIVNLEENNNPPVACNDGNPCTINEVYDNNCDCIGILLDDNNNNICDLEECITTELYVMLQGNYDTVTNEMTTKLNTERGLLPGQTPTNVLATPTPQGQPYSDAPWNYAGGEGADWTDVNYSTEIVDWILISFRTGQEKNTEIAQAAALLNKNGLVEFPTCALLNQGVDSVYVVIEHRNHMGVMSPSAVPIIDGVLNYDFRTTDSYKDLTSYGQKQLPDGNWCMYAGDGDQSDFPSYDIKGFDKAIWFPENGLFEQYSASDFNLDGDVNGGDKAFWDGNNGVSSRVPK